MMPWVATYIGFLRAINLGPKRKFPQDAIRAAVEAAGGTAVETYLNTGNVRFDTTLRSRARIERALEEAFRADRGFDVPTIVLTPRELAAIAEHAVSLGHDGRHYVSLLKEEPSAASVARVEALATAEEVVKVNGRAVHLLLGASYHQGRLTNAVIERHLGVATNRNLTVVEALVDKWSG